MHIIKITAIAFLAAGCLFFTGCAGSATNATPTERTAAKKSEPTTLRVYYLPSVAIPLLPIKKKYEEAYPGNQVNFVRKDQNELEKALNGEGAETPDLVLLNSFDYPHYLRANLIQDLTLLIKNDNYRMDDYFTSVVKVSTVDGKLAALPLTAVTNGFYYNKQLFDKAGLAYPSDNWTWQDFVDLAKKLTKYNANGNIVEGGVEMPAENISFIEPFIWSRGGDTLSPDVKKVKGYLDGPATIDAMERYVNLFRDSRVALNDTDPARNNLFSLKTAFAYVGSGAYDAIVLNNDPSLRAAWEVINLPSLGKPSNQVWSRGITIAQKTKNKQQAWEFAKFFAESDTLEASTLLSPKKSNAQKQIAAKDNKFREPLYKQLELARFGLQLPEGFWFIDDELMKAVFRNGASVKDALSTMAEQAQARVK